ncbi:MAG: hypothetical protein A3H35_14830 [Betaproteobacteria bacterium RIFCSPLOWO2_02_FULL_62_17]|nr:MAG: hypothetical protein A3H35_14830 [Betaproteobacteria bacterium RIFCSPLOWO2_02_FULL_62_17]
MLVSLLVVAGMVLRANHGLIPARTKTRLADQVYEGTGGYFNRGSPASATVSTTARLEMQDALA